MSVGCDRRDEERTSALTVGESPRGAVHGSGSTHLRDRGGRNAAGRKSGRLAEAGFEPSPGSVGAPHDDSGAATVAGLHTTGPVRREGTWRDMPEPELRPRRVPSFDDRRLPGPAGDTPPAKAEADCHAWRDLIHGVA
jgi:hypothetical protein